MTELRLKNRPIPMAKSTFLIRLVAFVAFFKATHAEFVFTSISSSALLADSTYKIATTVEMSQCPVDFEFKILSQQNELIASQEQTLNTGVSEMVEMEIGELDDDFYNLTVKATSCGSSSAKSIKLQTDHHRTTMFIETDKPIYKGGDTVKFRVLILNRFLQPFTDDMEINLKIYDPLNNLIKSKEGLVVPGDKGLISKTFELAKEPNLGDWKIQVKMGQSNELKEQTFTVDQYVLPKFKIDIDLSSPFVTFNDSDITIGTTVMYTFGKPVSGECTITIQEVIRYFHPFHLRSYFQLGHFGMNLVPPELKNVSKTVSLTEGKGFADFNLVNDLGIQAELGHGRTSVNIMVSCKDGISGSRRNESKVVGVYKQEFKIENISGHSKEAKPGLPCEIVLRISTQDDLPIHDPNEDALRVESDTQEILRSSIPPSGLVRFQVPSKPYYSFQVWYKGFATSISIYVQAASHVKGEDGYIQLTLMDGITPMENGRVGIHVNSTVPFKTLTAIMTSRRVILNTTKVVLDEATNETDIFLTLPPNSVPQIEMIVYFTTDLGQVVLDQLKIVVKPDLSQSPRIYLENYSNYQERSFEPGTNISIKVTGQPEGIIALKAIDQSVLLLKKDSSVDSKMILEQGKNMNSNFYYKHRDWQLRGAYKNLQQSNLVLLTNIEGSKLYQEHKRKLLAQSELEERDQLYYMQRERHREQTNKPTNSVDVDYSYAMPMPPPQQRPQQNSEVPYMMLPPTITGFGIGSAPSAPVIRERSFFPETWIWEDHDSEDSELTIEKTVPDTITSWIITGYQISPEHGLRISSPEQFKLTAFRPFFIYLNLPYSIVKGEILALQVIVHNYMSTPVNARVTLQNQEKFFRFMENETTTESSMYKDVEVNASSVASVTFPISPVKFGTMALKVTATSPFAGDAVKRFLIVKPPGVRQIHNSAVLLNVLSEESVRATIKPFFPLSRIPDADSLTISIIGDIMGSTIGNLDNLIRLPYGCGEQNMLNFVPNIVVLDYFSATRQSAKNLKPLKRKAERYLETGYQKELTFWRTDGSFSIWGNRDSTGSTWLTAFVIKSFISAKKYITIDKAVVDKSLKFLIGTQQPDGSFRELGFVHDKSLQGGAGSKHGLAAYILLAFVEARRSDVYLEGMSIDSIINKGLDFLIREELEGRLTEAYPLVLLSYLLYSTSHKKKEDILSKLDKLAIIEQSINQKHWEPTINRLARGLESNPTRVTSASVEMTAYALLTYLSRESTPKKRIDESLPIANWLLKQQNAQGGFKSTQDTVIGITALAKMAQALSAGVVDEDEVKVEASWPKSRSSGTGNWECNIGKLDRTSIQEYILPSATKDVKFQATGKGTALVHLTWSYYTQVNNNSQAFNLQVQVTSGSKTGGALHLKISTSYLLPGKSNMAIVEANAPSGFEFDYEELRALEKSNRLIKRFEMKKKSTSVHFYFDSLSSSKVEFTLSVFPAFRVAKHSASSVIVYDYYDTTQRIEAAYEVPLNLLCDLCKDDGTCKIPTCK